MTQLSEHFSFEELTATSHAELDNTPPQSVIAPLNVTAGYLEMIRALLGDQLMHINSGYRSPAVNLAVGGVADSAHLTGYAADFICPAFGAPIDICRAIAASPIRFDQLIEEGNWVHVSFAPAMRGEILTKAPAGGYRAGLPS